MAGAAAHRPATRTLLDSRDTVVTVGPSRAPSAGRRTSATLTPNSLTLITIVYATIATANTPKSRGASRWASRMPTASWPTRPTTLLTRLHANPRVTFQ